MRKLEHISIIGMGALGILFGNYFQDALGEGTVTFLADDDRVEKYRQRDFQCNGQSCSFQVKNPSKEKVETDLLIFAVKFTAMDAAIELAKHVVTEDTVIISILNGISSEEYIEEHLGVGTVFRCVAQGMDAVNDNGHLTYSNMGELCIGLRENEEDKEPAFESLKELFTRVKLPHTVEEDICRRLWCKWMLNVGANQTMMVMEGTYDTIQQPGEARDMMKAAMEEVIALAKAEGIRVTTADLEEYVRLTDMLNPQGMTSMRQDGLAHRKSEVELFAGTVIKKAKKYGLEVPVNQDLYQRIQAMEANY